MLLPPLMPNSTAGNVNATTEPSSTEASPTTEEDLNVAPTDPVKEVEPAISLSIFFMFLLLGELYSLGYPPTPPSPLPLDLHI